MIDAASRQPAALRVDIPLTSISMETALNHHHNADDDTEGAFEEELITSIVGWLDVPLANVTNACDEVVLQWGLKDPFTAQTGRFARQSATNLAIDVCGQCLDILQSPSCLVNIVFGSSPSVYDCSWCVFWPNYVNSATLWSPSDHLSFPQSLSDSARGDGQCGVGLGGGPRQGLGSRKRRWVAEPSWKEMHRVGGGLWAPGVRDGRRSVEISVVDTIGIAYLGVSSWDLVTQAAQSSMVVPALAVWNALLM